MTETETAAPAPAGRCAREGCAVGEGGPCAREFTDPFECDDFEPAEAGTGPDDSDAAAASDPAPGDVLDVRGRTPWRGSGTVTPLHSAQALTLEEASRVRQGHTTAVAVPVGAVDVGKTTLLAAIYETVAAGDVDGWTFAGSLSLIGFEERSFLATLASGGQEPATARTSRDTDQVLLHLAFRDKERQDRHLLVGDVSGEHADSLRRYNDPGDYAPLLRAATCVLLLIDGQRLADSRQQHAAVAEASITFRALHESGLVGPDVPVLLVATKWDLCATASVDLTPITDAVERTGRKTEVVRMAVRAPSAKLPPEADSVGALVDHMMCLPERREPKPGLPPPPAGEARRFAAGSPVAARFAKAAPR